MKLPNHSVTGAFITAAAICLSACGKTGVGDNPATNKKSATGTAFSAAPKAPDGPLDPKLEETLVAAVDSFVTQDIDIHADAVFALGKSGDPRIGWVFSDFLRLSVGAPYKELIAKQCKNLLEIEIDPRKSWGSLTDHLIAWDTPAPPDYLSFKRKLYAKVDSGWERIMSDPGEVDWRLVAWGGVGIDDRPYDQTDRFIDSIPGVDNPKITDVNGGAWLDDEAHVFGVEIDGETRAYPRFIMEIREMVNDTLGGRDFAMPYCTLCGAAQVWFTDRVPEGVERPILRTSGLLIRSNKLMYDVVSGSVFDTFLGHATNGPLHRQGVKLPGHTVVSTTWGEWKKAHPDTTIVAQEEARGEESDLRNTRDADGPIFPIGEVDQRLPVQEDVVGVISSSGLPVAFPVKEARKFLGEGKTLTFKGVTITQASGGLVASGEDGAPLVAHESFWFGWSQFRPDTALWRAEAGTESGKTESE